MSRYLVDSTIFVSILRKKIGIASLYKQLTGEIITSSICAAELYEGVYKSENTSSNLKEVENLLQTVQSIVSFGTKEAEMFGQLKGMMKRILIPDMDMQIAATCFVHDCTLVTLDNHFTRVPNLLVHHAVG